MKLNELDQWLDELENDCCQDSTDGNMAEPSYNDLESELKERVMSEIQELIHYSSNTGDDIFSGSINEIDVESVLENFNPEPSQKSASDKKKTKKIQHKTVFK